MYLSQKTSLIVVILTIEDYNNYNVTMALKSCALTDSSSLRSQRALSYLGISYLAEAKSCLAWVSMKTALV